MESNHLVPGASAGCICLDSSPENRKSTVWGLSGVDCLSLYQVTVLRVLHGICTHVAWLVET